MNRMRQRRKQLQENLSRRCIKRSVLAWMLCVTLVFGGIWVPETGMAVRADAKVSAKNSVEEYHSSEESFVSWDAADVSEGDSVSGNAVSVMLLNSAEDYIVGGTYKNITWRIDANGKLVVEGTGEFSALAGYDRAPWYGERKSVKSAEIRISGLRDATCMFYGCSELTSVNLSGWDTSGVTDMEGMFWGCSGLTSLDMSGWDTSGVTDMSDMFYNCSGLTSLNMSGWDTSGVKYMKRMFGDCSGLTSLDVSSFDTSSVTDMSYMFYGCDSLTSLDVSGFDASSVTDMSYMFDGCSGLTSLDMSGWNASGVKYMEGMFWGCSGLTSLDMSGLNISRAESGSLMFEGCSNITQIKTFRNFNNSLVILLPVSMHDDAGNVYFKYFPYDSSSITLYAGIAHGTYKDIIWRIDADGKLTVEGTGEFSASTEDWRAPWYGKSAYITSAVVRVTGLQNASYMFCDCYDLTSLDVSGFDTSSVTDMSYMFYGCDSLTSLDVSSFDTSSVTDMSYMFYGCDSLTSLDVSGFDTSSVTDMFRMFLGCDNITQINTFPNLQVQNVKLPVRMHDNNGNVYGFFPVGLAESIILYVEEESKNITWMIDADGKLTVEGTGDFSVLLSEQRAPWYSRRESIKSAVVRVTGLQNANYMFAGCSELISVDLSEFDTSNVTDMSYMFYNCSSLTSLDVSGFDTSNVIDMSYMFYDCSSLTSLDVSGFDTSSVIDTRRMFEDCSSLTSVDLSSFDTSNVESMRSMFEGCSSLMSLDMSSFDVSRLDIGDDSDMFDDCTKLSILYTPYNVPMNYQVVLPTVEITDVWYDAAGIIYATLPEGVDHSIVLAKNAIPAADAMQAQLTVLLAKSSYEMGSTILPKDLTVKYRGTDGRTVTLSYRVGESGTGYTMSDVDMSTPGTKTLTISYNDGTNTLTESVTFIVLKSSVDPTDPDDPTGPDAPDFSDDGTFRISAVSAQTYTGSAIKPAVVVYYGSRRLTEKTDYTVTYKNNIKANDATVEQTAPTITVTGKGNYSGKQTITFVIKPKDITEEDVTATELIAAQSNRIQKPVPTLTWQGKKLKNKTDFTVSYPDESKSGAYQTAGTYAVTVTGTGNYTGMKNLTYTITNKTLLTKAKVTVKTKDYMDSAVTLSAEDITVKVGNATLAYGTDYTLSYRNNTQAGKATVIVTGTGDSYVGSKEADFQIKGESLAKAQITGVVDKTYTGTAQTQNIQVQLSGKTLQEGIDYIVSYAKEVNAGTASVIVTGKGGYTGTLKKSFKITAYDLQADEAGKLQGVPKNLTTAYVKGGATPTLALTFNGKSLVAKKDYTVTYKNNKKPGAAADTKAPVMIVKGKGNFRGTLSISFAITVSNLKTDGNVTITAADTAYVNKPGKYAVKPVLTDANGKKLTAGTDYEKTLTYALVNPDGTETVLTSADIVSEGGTVKVTATGKGNYAGTLSATYHITKFSFSKAKITVTPQIYTGVPVTLSEKDITVKIGRDTLTYGMDYTIVPDSYQNNTKKGTATVTIKGMGDYGGTKTVKFKVTAKPLAAWLKF